MYMFFSNGEMIMDTFFEILDWLKQLDAQTLSGVSIAVVLAAVWIFFKVIRKIIGLAFFLCLVYIGLKLCGI